MAGPCDLCAARCCREYVISITSFDALRIIDATSRQFEDFAQLAPPRILNLDNDVVLEWEETGIREEYALSLKSHPCIFLKDGKCAIHEFAPLVCACYPYNSASRIIPGARCPIISKSAFMLFGTNGNTKEYGEQLQIYKKLVSKWNSRRGSREGCIAFLLEESKKIQKSRIPE